LCTASALYNARVNRRTFLGAAACSTKLFAAPPQQHPIIDTHIHLFDISRPEGVPWPPKNSSIYKSSLPDSYRKLTAPFGITGAIAVECSPWPADNDWVLNIARDAPIILGMVGNLELGTPDFGKQLERLHKNSLFRGIRYGNLWGYNLPAQVDNPVFDRDDNLYLTFSGTRGIVYILPESKPPQAVFEAAFRPR